MIFYTLSLVAQMVENLPAMQETWVQSLGQKIPWRRERLLIPVFLPGESHGQRSLAGSLLPLETRPDSPGESRMQCRDSYRPSRGTLGPGHKPR